MKKLKKINQFGFIAFCIIVASFFSKRINAQDISNHFFGENAWMPDTIGNANACMDPPCVFNGKLHQQWSNVKDSHASIIRFGGISPDKNMPTDYQYIRVIDSIRANGMEPIVQVPYYNNRYTSVQAADIVRYINVTKGRHIKYWIIGNEPNLSYSYTSASQIANYIKPFSSAMKNVDPSILIVGPECAWFDQPIMDGLTAPNGPDDITGKDAMGRYYLDVISFHMYPFNGNQTRAQVISKLTSTGGLQDNLIYLNNRIASCNSAHNRTGASALKAAITEANIAYQNSSTDNLYGLGTNSFIGGQFIAEMIGVGMKNNLDFINVWSVIEGSGLGYLDNTSGNKKPSYYHFKLLAENFKGIYVNGTVNQANVKSFGSQNSQQTSVMILNEDASTNYNYTVRLNTTAITGSNPLKININAGIANEYNDVIQNQSSVLLVFNSTGALVKKCEYSLLGNAVANKAPTCTDLIATGIPDTKAPNHIFNLGIKVFPNPSVGKFTIKLKEENFDERTIEIKLINIIGQEVYSKNSIFSGSKEEIELDPSIANGVYFVRVKEGNQLVTEKIIIEK